MAGPRTMRAHLALAVGAAVTALTLWAAPVAQADPGPPPGAPTAHSIKGVPTVGPIFRDGLQNDHGCTASVVASPTRDLILTAAHCVAGTAAGWLFAPGYDKGATPYGTWKVTHAYVDPAWTSRQDPQHDFAFLQVADHVRGGRRVTLQQVTGANRLGSAPRTGRRATDIAYNEGIDDRAISCTVRAYRTGGYPTFSCHGYVGGSSGSPWLVRVPGTSRHLVVGLIGGLHQGGCYEYTSYSSAFGADIHRLWWRAVRHVRPDDVPQAGGDGC